MKKEICVVTLYILFIVVLQVFSSDPSFNYPPPNNGDEYCIPDPCEVEQCGKSALGIDDNNGGQLDGPLFAYVGSKAFKDSTEFKWFAYAAVENDDYHIKGQYSLDNYPPDDPVVIEYRPDQFQNVGADDDGSYYFDKYEGEINVLFARQTSKPFNNQNATIEIDTIDAVSHISGRERTDQSEIITPEHIARAHLSFDCDCNSIEEDVEEDRNEPDETGKPTGSLEDSGSTTTTLLADTSTRTLSPNSLSYTYATVGSTHYASLTSSIPYESVVWQVEPPGHSGNTLPIVETDTGDGSLTEATLSYSFPSDVTGTYKIMAYVWYSDSSARQMSYEVSVTLEPGLRPINGSSYYANGGDTYEMGLVTNAPYSRVEWYMKPAGDTSPDGANVETDYAVGTTTEAELRHTLPNGTPGTCTITAHVFKSDGTDYQVTYNVYVY